MGLGKYNALAWMLYITLAQVLKLFLVVYNALARALELLPAAGADLVSQAIRIFPRAHAREKGGGGREGKKRLVRCARFSFQSGM